MKAELEKKLLEKYPHFFQHDLPIYSGDSTKEVLENTVKLLNQKEMVIPIQFGFECGNGWYMLLDELMGEIDNHLKNVNRNNKNKFKYQWMWNLQAYLRRKYKSKSKMYAFAEWIYEKSPRKKIPEVTIQIDQIKEKFGGLRFYYSGGDDAIDGMTSLAESLSYKICESCGTTKNVGQTGGWIYTVCWDCLQKNERANNLEWKANE
jgi:hypothetical protein